MPKSKTAFLTSAVVLVVVLLAGYVWWDPGASAPVSQVPEPAPVPAVADLAADEPEPVRVLATDQDKTVASIALSFHTGRKEPVSGISVVLVRDEGQVWRSGWHPRLPPEAVMADAVSGRRGLVSFEGLVAGRYRWGAVDDTHTFDVAPPFEVARVVPTNTGVRHNAGVPRRLSGIVELSAGEERQFEVLVYDAGVRGSVADLGLETGHDEGAQVALYERLVHRGSVGLELERQLHLPRLGAFRFDYLKPGEKMLTVDWLGDENASYRRILVFRLEAGRVHDLGVVGLDGESLVVTAPAHSQPVRVRIQRFLHEPLLYSHSLSGVVPVGGQFVFHGLPAGEFKIITQGHDDPHPWRVPQDGGLFEVPPPALTEDFRVQVLADSSLGRVHVELLQPDGRQTTGSARLEPRGGGWQAGVDIPVRDQPTVVLVKCGARQHRDNWLAFNFVAPGERAVTMRMRPAVTLDCAVQGLTELPNGNALAAGPAGHDLWPWPIRARDGRFKLGPLLPGMALDFRTFDGSGRRGSLVVPELGNSTEVLLEMR